MSTSSAIADSDHKIAHECVGGHQIVNIAKRNAMQEKALRMAQRSIRKPLLPEPSAFQNQRPNAHANSKKVIVPDVNSEPQDRGHQA
jgi:hypothetical protein